MPSFRPPCLELYPELAELSLITAERCSRVAALGPIDFATEWERKLSQIIVFLAENSSIHARFRALRYCVGGSPYPPSAPCRMRISMKSLAIERGYPIAVRVRPGAGVLDSGEWQRARLTTPGR